MLDYLCLLMRKFVKGGRDLELFLRLRGRGRCCLRRLVWDRESVGRERMDWGRLNRGIIGFGRMGSVIMLGERNLQRNLKGWRRDK